MNDREKLSETVFDSVTAMMAAYAEEAVRTAWSDHRQVLDFTEASVVPLERLLDGQAAEDLEFQTRLWGSYFGEVLRRRFGGEWELAQYPGRVAAIPALEIAGSHLFPLMKIYRRLTMGESENLLAFYEMVDSRLGGKPQNQTPPAESSRDV